MMERTRKNVSPSGYGCIRAGIYALAGTDIARNLFDYNPGSSIVLAASVVLVMAVGTAV